MNRFNFISKALVFFTGRYHNWPLRWCWINKSLFCARSLRQLMLRPGKFTKIVYFIRDYLKEADFLLSRLFVWAGRQHWPMSEKISQNRTAFVFGNSYLHQTFTECVSVSALTCQMWLQVMELSLINHSCLKYFIFTKFDNGVFLSYVWLINCKKILKNKHLYFSKNIKNKIS